VATVLLTGGRAPVTLELARLFRRAGHRVLMAESLAWHLSRPSLAVAANFRVPPPRQDPTGFIRALAQIVRREGVDLLVPTCEEIYAVARGRAELEAAGGTLVLAEPLEKLRGLHDKWLFTQSARGLGLSVPETRRLESAQDLRAVLAAGGEWVLKPVFSRFAARTHLPPHSAASLQSVRPSPRQPWVAQACLRGRQVCTYSLAHHGQLAAHVAYPVEFSAGQGAAVAFRAIEHPAAQAWAARFVAAADFTGQIAFDFIEDAAGQVAALECNPRATSGVHLLAGAPGFDRAYFGPLPSTLSGAAGAPAMLAAGMLLYALPAARSWAGLRRWAAAFARSRDVVFNWRDPLPGLLQGLSLIPFAAWGLRHHLSLVAASTYDIEWNGDV
jgi:predicted ATP-grasp superfamily ATP-dependent carboligase